MTNSDFVTLNILLWNVIILPDDNYNSQNSRHKIIISYSLSVTESNLIIMDLINVAIQQKFYVFKQCTIFTKQT